MPSSPQALFPREVVRRIRQLQIRAKRAVRDLFGGRYRSIFKGAGVAFEEVREYQPGDEVRSIDWNVTARMGHPYVKRFVEERELTVMLLMDVSGSQSFGTQQHQKREVSAELAALLAFSAISNNDKVGLLAFTDQVERFLPPRKSVRHALRLIRDVLFFQPSHTRTCLREGLEFLNRVLHRRSVVFLLSDFWDQGYERVLRQTSLRHDLIAIRVHDPREDELPSAGLVRLQDAETGQQILLDTTNSRVRATYADQANQRRERFRQWIRGLHIDLIEVSTDGTHLDGLIGFFQARERRFASRTAP
jgi:uncharacterized protein (DUF58 family)